MSHDQEPPEVKSGQVWVWKDTVAASGHVPSAIKVVCPYPFAEGLWIVERVGVVEALWRLPEVSLREYYDLRKEPAS